MLLADAHTGGHGMALVAQAGIGVALWGVSALIAAPVFGDGVSVENAGLAGALIALGAALPKLLDYLTGKRKDSAVERDADFKRSMEEKAAEVRHMEQVLVRYKADLHEAHEQAHAIAREKVRADRRAAEAVAWIRANQMLMRERKMEFVPFDLDDSDDAIRPHGPDGGV
jgi:hypothetical protein